MRQIGAAWLFAVGSRPGRPTTVGDIGAALADYGSSGGTLMPSVGLWAGTVERSVVAIIAGLTPRRAFAMAAFLAARFKQDSVYVQGIGTAHLVSAHHPESSARESSRTPDGTGSQLGLDFLPSESRPPARVPSRRQQEKSKLTRTGPLPKRHQNRSSA
jgi:hypothetical protein